MGDQLDSDIARIGVNEEDLSIDIVSNAEDVGFPSITKDNAEHNDASPHMKRLPVGHDAVEDTKQGSTFVKFNEQNYFTVLALKRPFFLAKPNMGNSNLSDSLSFVCIVCCR